MKTIINRLSFILNRKYWGDPTMAKKELGWNPQSTTFEQLVELMVKHWVPELAEGWQR